MIEPENMPFDDKSGDEAVNNIRQNENTGMSNADMPQTDPSDQDRLDQATQASEASFTLEPEKGIPPGPDSDAAEQWQDDYNLRQ